MEDKCRFDNKGYCEQNLQAVEEITCRHCPLYDSSEGDNLEEIREQFKF